MSKRGKEIIDPRGDFGRLGDEIAVAMLCTIPGAFLGGIVGRLISSEGMYWGAGIGLVLAFLGGLVYENWNRKSELVG